ncbi:MAG: hypothetical protein ACYCT2_04410 [Thermoplasmataceae archaeon]
MISLLPKDEIGDLFESEKLIRARITGRPPGILMHRMNLDALSREKRAKRVSQTPTREVEAEAAAYRMESGELYIPSEALYGSIVNAGKAMRFGKMAASQILATIRIFPQKIPLGTSEYEIDERSAVVMGSRILRARPLIRKWSVEFFVVLDSNLLAPDSLEVALRDAGRRVGILDFRPQHRGQFGTFVLDEFEEAEL